jgi:hypothetical protein
MSGSYGGSVQKILPGRAEAHDFWFSESGFTQTSDYSLGKAINLVSERANKSMKQAVERSW